MSNTLKTFAALSMVALVAACGSTRTERGLSGGAIGAGAGAVGSAVTGGSALGGAAVGGVAGAAVGALTDEDQINLD